MQRSNRPKSTPRSRLTRGASAAAATLAVTVVAMTAAASGAQAGVHSGGAGYPTPSATSQSTTAAYVYLKLDPKKKAAWENSGQQYLVATWPGDKFKDITWEQIEAANLPVEVCGPDWGVQEDVAWGDATVFTSKPAPKYPTATIGWPPIYDADHFELEDHVGTVPACAPATPAPTSSATPPAPPKPVETHPAPPAPTHTHPAPPKPTHTHPTPPKPTVTPTVAPTATPTPTPTPTVTPVAASTPKPTPSVTAQVLAANTKGAVLAATGSSAGPIGLAAGVLLLAGGTLVALRRRRGQVSSR